MPDDVKISMKNVVTCAMKPDKHGKCRFEFLCIKGLERGLASGSPLDSEWIPVKIRAVQGHSKAVLKRAGGAFAPATLMYCHPNVDPDRKAAFASVPISPMSEVPEVEYVSGQQVCHCCGFDELPIDETGKLKFQPNRRTALLERRMEKLSKFGVFGTVNQSLLASLTDQQAAELRSAIGKRGLTSIEASVLQDAKDKMRRAKSLGYEGVEDRYASDAQFCDRVH
eukprot:s2587_g15.t1